MPPKKTKKKKKHKLWRKYDIAKAVLDTDAKSKEQEGKAQTVQMFAQAELDAASRKVKAAKQRLDRAKNPLASMERDVKGKALSAVLSGPLESPDSLKAAKTARSAARKKVRAAKRSVVEAKKPDSATPKDLRFPGTTFKKIKKLAVATVEGEKQKQKRMKKTVKAAKTQKSMTAFAKKKAAAKRRKKKAKK